MENTPRMGNSSQTGRNFKVSSVNTMHILIASHSFYIASLGAKNTKTGHSAKTELTRSVSTMPIFNVHWIPLLLLTSILSCYTINSSVYGPSLYMLVQYLAQWGSCLSYQDRYNLNFFFFVNLAWTFPSEYWEGTGSLPVLTERLGVQVVQHHPPPLPATMQTVYPGVLALLSLGMEKK